MASVHETKSEKFQDKYKHLNIERICVNKPHVGTKLNFCSVNKVLWNDPYKNATESTFY